MRIITARTTPKTGLSLTDFPIFCFSVSVPDGKLYRCLIQEQAHNFLPLIFPPSQPVSLKLNPQKNRSVFKISI
jgi:hypothetical protein